MLARNPAAQCTHSRPGGTSSSRWSRLCSGTCTEPAMPPVARSSSRRTSSTTVRIRLERGGQVGEGPPRVAAGAGRRGELADRAGCGTGGTVDPDPDELALRVGGLRRVLPDQGERGAPRDDPAEVGRELLPEGDPDAAGQVLGGIGGAVAQVHDPLAGGDALAEGVGVGRFGGCQVRGGRAGGVERPHVCVVGGVGGQAGEKPDDERVLVVGGERVVAAPLVADGAAGHTAGRPGRAHRPKPVRG